MRMAAGGPNLVVLRERDIDDGAQRLGVADGCNAACGVCNP
jgi:hypothetical protein